MARLDANRISAWRGLQARVADVERMIDAALRDQIADYKRPRLLLLADELPRNALGKLQKHRLSQAVAEMLASGGDARLAGGADPARRSSR